MTPAYDSGDEKLSEEEEATRFFETSGDSCTKYTASQLKSLSPY
jgi:hypothetical protein